MAHAQGKRVRLLKINCKMDASLQHGAVRTQPVQRQLALYEGTSYALVLSTIDSLHC